MNKLKHVIAYTWELQKHIKFYNNRSYLRKENFINYTWLLCWVCAEPSGYVCCGTHICVGVAGDMCAGKHNGGSHIRATAPNPNERGWMGVTTHFLAELSPRPLST